MEKCSGRSVAVDPPHAPDRSVADVVQAHLLGARAAVHVIDPRRERIDGGDECEVIDVGAECVPAAPSLCVA